MAAAGDDGIPVAEVVAAPVEVKPAGVASGPAPKAAGRGGLVPGRGGLVPGAQRTPVPSHPTPQVVHPPAQQAVHPSHPAQPSVGSALAAERYQPRPRPMGRSGGMHIPGYIPTGGMGEVWACIGCRTKNKVTLTQCWKCGTGKDGAAAATDFYKTESQFKTKPEWQNTSLPGHGRVGGCYPRRIETVTAVARAATQDRLAVPGEEVIAQLEAAPLPSVMEPALKRLRTDTEENIPIAEPVER
eukprot:Hpha_TRINITY_DN29786_c0_g1::TRINITY_DN29786_c0_g1_i1::g.2707::m.2707